MTAAELLAGLRERGVMVHADGDRLEYDAPPGVVTPTVLETLRQAKPQILTLLAQEERAFQQIRAAYRNLGAAVPAGGLKWCERHRPDLMAALDAAEEQIDPAFADGEWAALPVVLRAFAAAAAAIGAACREHDPSPLGVECDEAGDEQPIRKTDRAPARAYRASGDGEWDEDPFGDIPAARER